MQETATARLQSSQQATDYYEALDAAVSEFLASMQDLYTGAKTAQHIATLHSARERIAASFSNPIPASGPELGGSGPTLTWLPVELITQIADYLEQPALRALTLTCRYTHQIVLKLLYRRPVFGDLLKGDSYRFVCSGPSVHLRSFMTSLVCTQWNSWEPWFIDLEPLPNLLEATLSNVAKGRDRRVSLRQSLMFFARQPRVRSATLLYPLDDLDGSDEARPVAELTSLELLGISQVSEPQQPLCDGLARLCPKLTGIKLTLSRDLPDDEGWPGAFATFEPSDFEFLSDFTKLEHLDVDGFLHFQEPCQLSFVAKRLASIKLDFSRTRAFDVYDFLPSCPTDLFLGAHSHLNNIYWAGVCWDDAGRVTSSLAAFPSLKRLKLVRYLLDARLEGMGGDLNIDDLSTRNRRAAELEARGFSVHHCFGCVYAERASPERPLDFTNLKVYSESEFRRGEISCGCSRSASSS